MTVPDMTAVRTQAAIREIEAQRAAIADTLGSRAAELAALVAVLQEQLVASGDRVKNLESRVKELETDLAPFKVIPAEAADDGLVPIEDNG